MRIKAFRALHPPSDRVEQVASVPYDTVNVEEARALAGSSPHSFLHVVRAEIGFPDGTDPYGDAVYARAAENLEAFQQQGALVRDEEASLYLYELHRGDHMQRGLAACCHVGDYGDGVIRRNEKTREGALQDRTRLIKTLRAHTGPTFFIYRDSDAVDRAIEKAGTEDPLFDFVAPDGVHHRLWRLAATDAIREAFDAVPACYIADGHHRAASAVAVSDDLSAEGEAADAEHAWFLAVLFPASQVHILAYNRYVADLNGLTEADFLVRVGETFTVVETRMPAPPAAGTVHMYMGGKWYALTHAGDDRGPAGNLDVSRLQQDLLAPVLGIEDPRTNPRISFVPGNRGTGALMSAVDSGAAAVAFSLYPLSVEALMAVADDRGIMPPKSTWFEPKLRSGLLVHTF